MAIEKEWFQLKFILTNILERCNKYIKNISKSNKTLKFYNNWWGETNELIKSDLYNTVKHNMYSEMIFLL